MSTYRDRIYASYGKNFQDAPENFDRNASLRWGKARRYHLRGWLPESKMARIVDLACGGGKLLNFNDEELNDKIRFYLANDEACKRIAAAGWERCLRSGHSSTEQLSNIMAKVNPQGENGL